MGVLGERKRVKRGGKIGLWGLLEGFGKFPIVKKKKKGESHIL